MRKRNYIKIRADRGRKSAPGRKILIVVGIILAGYLLGSFILGEMGLVKYYRMKSQYHALNYDIAKLKQANAKLGREVDALKTDPACIERIARDKLGLARPVEIVYYYGEPKPDLKP